MADRIPRGGDVSVIKRPTEPLVIARYVIAAPPDKQFAEFRRLRGYLWDEYRRVAKIPQDGLETFKEPGHKDLLAKPLKGGVQLLVSPNVDSKIRDDWPEFIGVQTVNEARQPVHQLVFWQALTSEGEVTLRDVSLWNNLKPKGMGGPAEMIVEGLSGGRAPELCYYPWSATEGAGRPTYVWSFSGPTPSESYTVMQGSKDFIPISAVA